MVYKKTIALESFTAARLMGSRLDCSFYVASVAAEACLLRFAHGTFPTLGFYSSFLDCSGLFLVSSNAAFLPGLALGTFARLGFALPGGSAGEASLEALHLFNRDVSVWNMRGALPWGWMGRVGRRRSRPCTCLSWGVCMVDRKSRVGKALFSMTGIFFDDGAAPCLRLLFARRTAGEAPLQALHLFGRGEDMVGVDRLGRVGVGWIVARVRCEWAATGLAIIGWVGCVRGARACEWVCARVLACEWVCARVLACECVRVGRTKSLNWSFSSIYRPSKIG